MKQLARRFEDFEKISRPEFEHPDEPTLLGWILVGFVLVVTAALWFYATPAYLFYFFELGPHPEWAEGGHILGDGTVPGRRPGEVAIVMFDVGYGDGFLFQSPDNWTVLVDGGEGRQPVREGVRAYNWAYRLYLPLFDRIGLQKLDKLINLVPASHHAGVYPDLVSETALEVGKIYLTGYRSHAYSFRRLQVEAEEQGVPVKRLQPGQALDFGRGPKARIIYGDSDRRRPAEASHILLFKYGEITLLMAADLPVEGERKLIMEWGESLASQLLKVADHGSEAATSRELLEYVAPAYALISTSPDGPEKLPAFSVLQNLQMAGANQLFRTDMDGHVAFYTDGETIRIDKDPFPFLTP